MYLNDRWPGDLQNAWQTGRMGCLIFYICSDEAQVRDEVASRRAECGYVIDSGLEEKLDQKQWKRVIRLYMAPSTVAGSISTETVFSELAALYNRNLLMDYVEEGEAFAGMGPVNSSSRAKAAEEAGERYDRWNQEEGLFHFQYIYETNGGEDQRTGWRHRVQNLMQQSSIFPVRGPRGRHGFILSLYGGVMAGEDEEGDCLCLWGSDCVCPVVWQLQQRPEPWPVYLFCALFWAAWQEGGSFGAVGRGWGFCFYMDAAVRYLPLG